MGGAPIVIIFVVLGVITAMGVFFDFLSKAAARAAKEARERAQQERAARASGQPPSPAPRRQDAPPAIVELERYMRSLVEPDGQQGQGQPFQPPPQLARREVPVARPVPVGRPVARAQPARSARRIDAEQQSGHLEDHHLGTTIEGRRLEGEVERRRVVPTGGTLEGHHLQTQLSQIAGSAPIAARAQAPRGLAMIDRLPPMARALAYAELFGPPPGLGRGPKGPRRRFTRAVDA